MLNPYKISSIIIFVTAKCIFPNYILNVMCIIHLFNNSIIHIFYRTQVPIYSTRNFLRFWTKICSFTKHALHLCFTSQKIFKIFLFELLKTVTSRFPMFETCNCQSSFLSRTFCFCFTLHFR